MFKSEKFSCIRHKVEGHYPLDVVECEGKLYGILPDYIAENIRLIIGIAQVTEQVENGVEPS